MSKALMLAVLFACALFLAGCHTVSGAASGAAAGVPKDVEQVKKADAWLQKNLW
jgi:hypothetical protein